MLLQHNTNHPPCAATGKNPFEGYIPEVPDGERMDFGSDAFVEHERTGTHRLSILMLRQGIICDLNDLVAMTHFSNS